jgi:N-acetylmuramoyl-L-alanine amidase/FlgD Ig-like domain
MSASRATPRLRPLLAAAALAVAAPGTAAGAGLSLASRDLAPQRRAPVLVERFDLVGLHWRGKGTVFFRTRGPAGRWSAWHVAAPEDDDLPDRNTAEARPTRGWRLGSPFWTGGADAIQYRSTGRVTRIRAYFVRSPGVPVRVRHPQIAGRPNVITRAQWHADESIVRAAPHYADAVHLALVHHTAGSNAYSAGQSAAIVRAIEVYHVNGNGWNDIGYNFLVDKYGQVFEGRAGGMTRAVIGAHAEGFNVGTAGVAVIGDYSSATVTPATRTALVSLLAWRLDLDHVDPLSSVVRVSTGNPRYPAGRTVTLRAISAHRDVYPTSCPGTSLYAQLPAIRSAVAQTGLPKIYTPAVSGALGGLVRFTARLSARSAWTVAVRGTDGTAVAGGAGTGTTVDWTWDATAAQPGAYTWTIAVPQARSATGTIGTAPVPLALQQLRIAPELVTPNGDGRSDEAKISYRLTAAATVTATVLDSLGDTVATLFVRRRPAGASDFVWKQVTLPDGRYRLSLTAKDAAGKQAQSTIPLVVDRTLAGFAASALAISPNGDGRLDSLDFSFRLLAPAHVQVRILRGAMLAATLLDTELGAGPQRLTWDGGGLPDGRYSAVVSATDSLLTVKQSLIVRIDRRPPVLRLVSLGRLELWLSEPARVTIVLNGRVQRFTRRSAGFFRVAHAGAVRSLSAYAVDPAGNRSPTIRS